MARFRKYGKYVLVLLVLFVAAQFCVSMLARTRRVRGYLIAHLEQTFGRPVQAGRLSLQLLPTPSVDVEGISIGEDRAFGSEYFLRADRMTASFRWTGLLRGRFEFGTMALTRPSLNLVRNSQGRWNLEGWLPPARFNSSGAASPFTGPQLPAESTHHLQTIEIDDGRLNFKLNQEKSPFAFINVSGSLDQVASGKWQLRLEAVPWRSGVTLQSAGLLQVRGDVAGTSTRLRPALIHVHWEKASLADLSRLMTGNDFGLRGIFSMDADASTGQPIAGSESTETAPWQISVQARTSQIHRWDLTERSDNPNLSLSLLGVWDAAAGQARVPQWSLDLPHSRLAGSCALHTTAPLDWNVHVDSVALQAQDLLAWYRAFQPGVAEQLSADAFFQGSGDLSGWPVLLQNTNLSSNGGILHIPGLPEPAHFDSFHAETVAHQFRLIPVTIFLGSTEPASAESKAPEKNPAKLRSRQSAGNNVEVQFQRDTITKHAALALALHLVNADAALKVASAFGKPLNHGWELTGGVDGKMEWDFTPANNSPDWNASLIFSKAQLQAAGLNLPLKLQDVNIVWIKGKRRASITQAEAFGSAWSGTIFETAAAGFDQPRWQFDLHAEDLDAAELDRWIGPRSRPNWLQRLLPSLLRNNNLQAQPNELLRQIFAEGDLFAKTVTFEKFKLSDFRASLSLRDLHLDARNVQAKWADGNLRAGLHASFSPPNYDLSAEVDSADLAQIPWTPPGWAERWSGTASGRIHFTTEGVGRDDLLRQLAGRGEFKISSAEFRGWDVPASLEDGVLRIGISNWTGGSGQFNLSERIVTLQNVQLSLPHGKTQLTATLGPGPEAQFSFSPAPPEKRGSASTASRLLRVTGPLDEPQLSFVSGKSLTPQP
jgi:hypothetical protein